MRLKNHRGSNQPVERQNCTEQQVNQPLAQSKPISGKNEPVLNIKTAQEINIYNNMFIVNTASTAPQMNANNLNRVRSSSQLKLAGLAGAADAKPKKLKI